ncbi:MAG: FtsH protease activity modulator HflK [Acidobacteriota bacterium]
MAGDAGIPASVRLIWALRDALRRHRRRVLWGLAGAVFLAVAFRGFYTIDNGESGALLRFGALVDDAVAPGLHYRLPLGIDEVVEKRTGEVFRMEIAGDWAPRLSLVSGDENLIAVASVVQYRILRLGDRLFASDDAEALIHQTVRAELLEAAAGLGVDDLLTSAKAAVQQRVQLRSQERLDTYGLGVALVSVNLQSVDPPPEAEEAFRTVLDARADAARGVSMARTRTDRRLRLARGKAAQILAEAEAAADRRRQEARGAVERFEDLLEQNRRSPDLTRTDLYARTVQEVFGKTRLVVLPPGETDHIDLNLVDPKP